MKVRLPNIAFIGKAGAGKTTAREYLEEAFGYERISFAAPLKVMLGENATRGRMQTFGTEVVRAFEPDAWVNLLLAELHRRWDENNADEYGRGGGFPLQFANDDTRFPNEATALKAAGFIIVRVVAPRSLRLDRLKLNGRLQDEAQLDHVSETALDDFNADYTIANNEYPEDLVAQLNAIVNRERS